MVQAAFNLNRPLWVTSLAQGVSLSSPKSFFWLGSPEVVLDTIKVVSLLQLASPGGFKTS